MKERIEQFLEHLANERNLAANTIAAYRNDLCQFAVYLDARNAGRLNGAPSVEAGLRLDQAAVIDFVLSLKQDNGYAPATVARKIAAVKSLCHYLAKRGDLATDPTLDLGTPEVKKPLPRAVSVSQVNALLACTEERSQPDGMRDRAMLRLVYATGMRVTELVSLDVEDLDLDGGMVRCVGRGGRVRLIPLDEKAVQALCDYLGRAREALSRHGFADSALFLNQRGQRLTRQGFWLIMKQLARKAGITEQITPHTLRHSFAAHRLNDGIALQQLQEMLGHANISTTQVYAHLPLKPQSELTTAKR